jgi:hypothetical protein
LEAGAFVEEGDAEKCHAPKVEGEEGEEEEGKTMAGYKIHCTDQFDVFFIEMN